MHRWLSWILIGLGGGCASGRCLPPAGPGPCESPAPQPAETAAPVQVEHGRPNRLLDGAGRILGMPDQLLLWNSRVNNHQISPRTEEMVVGYLALNDLPDVLVRVNQYDPVGEWRRLVTNRRIGAGWRYTLGTFEFVLYTLVPGRLIGDDWYNPFTDTINLYSDVPAIALHEAAYAKNIHRRRFPGTYAALQYFPLVGMWYRTEATRDVLQYMKAQGSTLAETQEADRILYPMYGGALGGQIGTLVPFPMVDVGLNILGTMVGHVFGRVRADQEQPRNNGPAVE